MHPKGNQSWVFIGRTDVEAETLILWPPELKSWLIWKDPDAGKDWGQEEKGTTEDEMAGWHHWLDGRESEWTLGVGDGQGGLACCDSWGHKESDTTEWPIWSEDNFILRLNTCIFLRIVYILNVKAIERFYLMLFKYKKHDISYLFSSSMSLTRIKFSKNQIQYWTFDHNY